MSDVWTVAVIVVGGAILAAPVIYFWGYRSPRQPAAEPPHDPMRACRGCGDTFHESWGCICPNCSGAD